MSRKGNCWDNAVLGFRTYRQMPDRTTTLGAQNHIRDRGHIIGRGNRMAALLAIFLFCLPIAVNGQAGNYHFTSIDLPGPFKGQYITLVEEDRAGMLWFATNNGLHRFDGSRVLTFDMQGSPSLPDINIRSIMADDRQNLWVATRNKLVRFDLTRWTTSIVPFEGKDFVSVRDRFVSVLSKGLDSVVYVGFGNGKLYRIKNDRLSFITRLRLPGSDMIGDFLSINVIKEPVPGELWLATGKGQVVHIHHAGDRYDRPVYLEPRELGQTAIFQMYFAKNGDLIFHTEGKGTFSMRPDNGAIEPIGPPPGLFPLYSNGLFLDQLDDKKLFFFFAGIDTAKRGAAVYDLDKLAWENLAPFYPPFLKGTSFRTTRSTNGQIFIVTDRGLAKIGVRENPFRTFISSTGTINSVRSILKQAGGPMYVGSYQDRFISVNETTGQKNFLSNRMVTAMLQWGRDTILTAVEGGLDWYLERSNRFVRVPPDGDTVGNGGLKGTPLCICREKGPVAWIGTTAGLYLMDMYDRTIIGGRFAKALALLRQSKVMAVIKAGGYRFVATEEGLFRIDMTDGNMQKMFGGAGNVLADVAYNCLQFVDGEIWAGTSGHGIVVSDANGRIKETVTTANGLAANLVYSLVYSNGHILAGTGSGLSVVDVPSHGILNFSTPSYLPSNEFNRSAWNVAGDTVYMGTINGIVRFNVESLLRPSGPYRKRIGFSFLAENSGDSVLYDYTIAYKVRPSFIVPEYSRSFSIGLGGDNDDIGDLYLSYRLGGTSAWQNMGQQREITFVGMGPGSYDLEIGARRPDASGVGTLLNLPLTVLPAYYQSLWFKTVILIVGLLLLWSVVKFRERNLKKEQRLRRRIASDLHDEVGSALTRIYFQADGLANTIQPPSGDRSAVQRIAEGSQEALSSMSDMVWSIDAHFDNVADLVDRMKDHVSRLQGDTACQCTFMVLGSYKKWPMAQAKRQNVFLIFKEAMTNALKYSPDKKIDVGLTFADGQLALIVKNKVHEKQKKPSIGGHGLKNMELRATSIKGTFEAIDNRDSFIISLQVKI